MGDHILRGRGTFEGVMPVHCNVHRLFHNTCAVHLMDECIYRHEVARQHYGLLSNYFWHLFLHMLLLAISLQLCHVYLYWICAVFTCVSSDNRAALPESRSRVPLFHIPQASVPRTDRPYPQSTQVRMRQVHIWPAHGRPRKRHILPKVCSSQSLLGCTAAVAVATDGVAWSVCLSVCSCVCWSCSWALQKTAEPVEMQFWGWFVWAEEPCIDFIFKAIIPY